MKTRSKKGFTLAELLIVIAIIAILIAIMFPVFGAQLEKAKAAAELANVRAAYSEAVANTLLGDEKDLTVVVSTIQVKTDDLKKALQYDETTVTCVDGDGTNNGSITVEYKEYKGVFDTDPDVTFDDNNAFTKG